MIADLNHEFSRIYHGLLFFAAKTLKHQESLCAFVLENNQ